MAHAVSVLVDLDLVALNRAVGLLRRLVRSVESLTVGADDRPGLLRLTVTLGGDGDDAALDTMVKKLRKLTGVRDAVRLPVTTSH